MVQDGQKHRLHFASQSNSHRIQMAPLLGVVCFGLLATCNCLDVKGVKAKGVKAESFEDLLHMGAFQGIDSWTQIFQSFGQGARMDPKQLQKITGVPEDFEPTSKVQLDPNFGMQLGQEKIHKLVRSLKDKPEELMKIVNEWTGLSSACFLVFFVSFQM